VALAFSLLVFSLAACNKPAAQLPAGWPIPGLKLPPQSKIIKSYPGTDRWGVSFNCPLSDQDVTKHVESCLRKLGYLKRISTFEMSSYYFSPDGKYEVMILNARGMEAGSSSKKVKWDFAIDIQQLSSRSKDLVMKDTQPL